MRIGAAFGSVAGEPAYEAIIDCDVDGVIGGSDLMFFYSRVLAVPGPSGLDCAGTVPCTAP